jgi:carboxyl-terminal processing protease
MFSIAVGILASATPFLSDAVRASPDPSSDFYPMAVGDRWTYVSTLRGEFTNEVVGTERIDGRVHFRVESVDAGGRTTAHAVRRDGPVVHQRPNGGEERVFVDFGVPVGGSFETVQGEHRTRVLFAARHDTLRLGGAQFHDVREYVHSPDGGEEYRSYFARGIGLVGMQWTTSRHTVRLTHAVVGGRTAFRSDASTVEPAPEAREYLERALRIMEAQALHRHHLPWAEIRETAYRSAAGAQHPRDTYGAIAGALRALGDNHSRFVPRVSDQPAEVRAMTDARPRPEPETRRVHERVGYVAVPGFSGPGADEFARSILDGVFEVDGPEVCGWIVDLRGNTGGNMWPMLAGLSPILGDDVAGYFVTPDSGWVAWSIDHRARAGRRLARDHAAVAVLHDGATVSSGEAVVVAFRGRPQTRTFGKSTGGLSTANRTIPMPDGATMLLTVAVFADRERNLYGAAIEPDHVIQAEVPEPAVLAEAIGWLLNQPSCSVEAGATGAADRRVRRRGERLAPGLAAWPALRTDPARPRAVQPVPRT